MIPCTQPGLTHQASPHTILLPPHIPYPPRPLGRVPSSQHTTQQLTCFVAAWRIASVRRSTSTTSTVVSSLSRPNLAGVCTEVSAVSAV